MKQEIHWNELIDLYESSEGDTKNIYHNLIKNLAKQNTIFAQYAENKGIYL